MIATDTLQLGQFFSVVGLRGLNKGGQWARFEGEGVDSMCASIIPIKLKILEYRE